MTLKTVEILNLIYCLKKRTILQSQNMPNSANGVRGGPSKRSDLKKEQEPGSVNSRDSSRRNTEEPPGSIALLASSSGALQRLADIAQYFSYSFTHDINVVEEAYGDGIQKENSIRTLRETVETLTHVKSKELETLQRENEVLLTERAACQEEKKRYQEKQEKLKAQNTKAEASRQEESRRKLQAEILKFHKQSETEKAKIEEQSNKKAEELKEENVKLTANNAELKQLCLTAEDKLEKKKTRHARLEKSSEDEIKRLTEELKQIRQEVPIQERPVDH